MKDTPKNDEMELRASIPKGLLDLFNQQPRFVLKWRPNGIWPLDPLMLRNPELLRLVEDKEFSEQYEVVIMPKK